MNPLPSSFIETRVVVRPSIVRQYASRCNSSKQTTISIFSSRNNEKDDPPRSTKDFLTPAIFCQFFFITRDAQEAAVIKNVPHHPPPTRPQKDHPLIWNANTSISSPGIHHGVTHLGPDDNHHRRKVLKRDTERGRKKIPFSLSIAANGKLVPLAAQCIFARGEEATYYSPVIVIDYPAKSARLVQPGQRGEQSATKEKSRKSRTGKAHCSTTSKLLQMALSSMCLLCAQSISPRSAGWHLTRIENPHRIHQKSLPIYVLLLQGYSSAYIKLINLNL